MCEPHWHEYAQLHVHKHNQTHSDGSIDCNARISMQDQTSQRILLYMGLIENSISCWIFNFFFLFKYECCPLSWLFSVDIWDEKLSCIIVINIFVWNIKCCYAGLFFRVWFICSQIYSSPIWQHLMLSKINLTQYILLSDKDIRCAKCTKLM